MQVGFGDLTVWSFLMASAHGAGFMVLPFVIGMPFRIKYLDKALDYICSHDGVWRTTGWEIADWYYKRYYKDPGRFEG